MKKLVPSPMTIAPESLRIGPIGVFLPDGPGIGQDSNGPRSRHGSPRRSYPLTFLVTASGVRCRPCL